MSWGANKKGWLTVFDQWEDWLWTHAVTSSYIFGMPVLKNKRGNFAGLRLQAFEVIICPAWCQDLLLQEISISSQPPAYCNTGCLKEERQEKRETVQQHNQLVKSLCKVFRVFFLSGTEQDLLSHLTSGPADAVCLCGACLVFTSNRLSLSRVSALSQLTSPTHRAGLSDAWLLK